MTWNVYVYGDQNLHHSESYIQKLSSFEALGWEGINVGELSEVIILKKNVLLKWANNWLSSWIQIVFPPKYIYFY